MAKIINFTGIVAAAIVLLAVSTTAQDTPTTPTRLACVNATNIAFDANTISGVWYETARSPAAKVYCAQVNVGISPQNSSILQLNVTFGDNSNTLWVNNTVQGNITLGANSPDTTGYNISFWWGLNKYQDPVTYKLLAMGDGYCLACGYTNTSNNYEEFGIVLTRNRNIASTNVTQLNSYEEIGYNISTAFLNGSMPTVIQSDQCWSNNSATTTLPFFSAMFALIYMMLQFIN